MLSDKTVTKAHSVGNISRKRSAIGSGKLMLYMLDVITVSVSNIGQYR